MKVLLLSLLLISAESYAKEINIKVQGMICSMCAQGAKKKFAELPGVIDSKFELGNKDKGIPPTVVLITKDDSDVDDETIKKTIKEAGYNVASIERK